MRISSSDAISQLCFGRLDADLDVIEPGIDQLIEPRVVEKRSLRDEVRIQTRTRRGVDQQREVAAQCRLAAGKVRLDDA